MFDALLSEVVCHASLVTQRPEGVAFFKVAKDLYGLADVTYVCANISIVARKQQYMHCFYSDTCVKQFTSLTPLHLRFAGDAGKDVPRSASLEAQANGADAAEEGLIITLSLPERCGETAVFGITADRQRSEWREQHTTIIRECRILANYFHSHVLRINGYDSERELLISARELDCLKWTAAGKTAWEASVILGITERTVRFHLNAAREKLNCATTTQAVAKAVANRLIDV
jgi:DNA-binding CsgD family transcriptional regulator